MGQAILSGVFNDLGSGSNVDICVLTKVCIFLWVNSLNYVVSFLLNSVHYIQSTFCILRMLTSDSLFDACNLGPQGVSQKPPFTKSAYLCQQ